MSTRLSLLLAPLAVLCGCATSSPSNEPASSGSSASPAASATGGTGGSGGGAVNGNIIVNAAGRATSGLYKDDTLTAPQVSVSVKQDAARGQIAGAPVDLTLKESEIVGMVGNGQTRLQVQPQAGGGVMAQGMFAGSGSSLLLTPQKLEGRFLQCTYVLERAEAPADSATGGSGWGSSYQGKRNCVGSRETPTTVTLPTGFATLTPAQQVTLLNLVLSR